MEGEPEELMANSKTQIVKRLEEIKDMSSRLQVDLAASKSAKSVAGEALRSGLGLAEEAAGLGLELAALKAKKG